MTKTGVVFDILQSFLVHLMEDLHLPKRRIELKKGFKVMFLLNLCRQKGHVNGAKYIMEHILCN